MAAFVARLKIQRGTDAAFGPAINLSKCNEKTNYIEIINEPNAYGTYIESGQRAGFNFYIEVDGLKGEKYWRETEPFKFEDLYQKARAVLPKLEVKKI
jgi:hypothetical protein